jgi:heme/copper-type cytochrome/quinol oxidase subunit 4
MVTTYVISFIILIIITWLSLWVTKKAYSRKWDE